MMNIRVVSIRFTKVLIFSDKTKKYSSKTLICPTHHHLDIKKGPGAPTGIRTHYYLKNGDW